MVRKKFKPLRALLLDNDLNQADLARIAKISNATACGRMNGSTPWTAAEITRIAAALHIPAADIGKLFFEGVA